MGAGQAARHWDAIYASHGAGQAARHWDAIYASHGADHVSWAQRHAAPSLTALDPLDVDPTDPVIDVGGGISAFAGALARRGFTDITVLDISPEATDAGKSRQETEPITWQLGDVLDRRPEREYGLWHDRAVFHFLIARYSPTALAHELGPCLALVAPGDYEHQTPSGAIQGFIWLALRNDSRDPSPRA